jgi:benzodiazapine receptor
MNFVKKYRSLALIILATYVISIPAGVITIPSVTTWYVDIVKPSFNPPNFIFGPVWTTLYALMSVAVWNVWNDLKSTKLNYAKKVITIYFIHLLVAASWSYIFFGIHRIALAAFVIVCILAFIISLMRIYWKVNKVSFYLMIPYLLWSSYALLLNITIWKLN